MQPIKFSVVLLALTVKICWSGITVKHSDFKESSELLEAVINFVECYYESGSKAVGLAGHMPEVLHRTLTGKFIPVVLVDNNRIKANKPITRIDSYKLDVFVVAASSIKEFEDVLRVLTDCRWWSAEAHYLIVNWSSTESNGCTDPAHYLYRAWRSNMADAKVICQNHSKGVQLYSYNPYTDEAPKPWRLKKVYSGINLHPFAVFSREYRDSVAICETVGALALKKLAGYKLYVLDIDKILPKHAKSTGIQIFQCQNIIDTLALNLNLTPVYEKMGMQRLISSYYRFRKYMVKSLICNTAILTSPFAVFSYTIDQVEYYAITNFRGHLTQLEKVLSVTDISSRIGLCVVLLLTLFYFKYFVRQSVMSSFLNVIRIVCNTGFTHLPDDWPRRLFIGTVLLFTIVMQGVYQGNFATLLTQTLPIRDPMTRQDLFDLGYTIYAPSHVITIFFDMAMSNGQVVERFSNQPWKTLSKDPKAADVQREHYIKDAAWNYTMHVVGERIGVLYSSILFPIDSPLEERMNKILQTMVEADIMLPVHLRGFDRKVSDFEFDADVQKNQDYKVINFRELEFAFVILGIGLACATVSFIGELVIGECRSRARTTRTRMIRQNVSKIQNEFKRRRCVEMRMKSRPRDVRMIRNSRMVVPSISRSQDAARSPSRLLVSRPQLENDVSWDRRRVHNLSRLRPAPVSASFIRSPDVEV